MAMTTTRLFSLILVGFFILLVGFHGATARPFGLIDLYKFEIFRPLEKACHFNKIYQLGDSISDTGNLVIESPLGGGYLFTKLPYGETSFGTPTGRCSNGLLMIDYFALASSLPFLNPYKNAEANFDNGVNFAVAGATVLSSKELKAKHLPPNPATNSSLGVQLEWMSSHFKSTCHSKVECQQTLKSSLFMVGEIGGNDYNYAFFGNKSMEELSQLVPDVVKSTIGAVRKVIDFGATKIVVPGNFPIGCHPIYLSIFQTNDSTAYDQRFQCLTTLNNFAAYHNQLLQESIKQLEKEYPKVAIVYGDYFNAFLWLLSNAKHLGFRADSLQKACCGSGGSHNFSLQKMCGMPGVVACPNPDDHISWDGIHMTQQAYKFMAAYLIHSIIPQLRCRVSV